MSVILPGALLDAEEERALDSHIHRVAPSLQRWKKRARVHRVSAPPEVAGCTAYEQWQLRARGFVPEENQNLSAGLACLLAPSSPTPLPQPLSHKWERGVGRAFPVQTGEGRDAPRVLFPSPACGRGCPEEAGEGDEPLWFAELVHLALASDGAALVPARSLHIRTEDSQALFDSAQDLFQDSGFAIQMHSPTHWRVLPSEPLQLRCASPELVATSSLHDWWPQEVQAKAWRRLLNAVQMCWFDHPVNRARATAGLLPVNGLWLFGGARATQWHPVATDAVQVIDRLYSPWLQQDWGSWLQVLGELETTLFAPLARTPHTLVLIGKDAIVEWHPRRRWWWFGR